MSPNLWFRPGNDLFYGDSRSQLDLLRVFKALSVQSLASEQSPLPTLLGGLASTLSVSILRNSPLSSIVRASALESFGVRLHSLRPQPIVHETEDGYGEGVKIHEKISAAFGAIEPTPSAGKSRSLFNRSEKLVHEVIKPTRRVWALSRSW